jgi:hypothetical protein
MEWQTKPIPGPNETVTALNRIASAIERLADAYLYCNAPDEDGEPQHMGQSLSDAPGRVGQ